MEFNDQHVNLIIPEITELVGNFSSIPLQELSAGSQMSRFDKKYLFSSTLLPSILKEMQNQYDILDVEGNRILNYQSTYYDTDQLAMYMAHHNGKCNRYKIRYREYLESGDQFLEIKHKNNKGFTVKRRIPISEINIHDKIQTEYIDHNSFYSANQLHPALQTSYKRMTFVNRTLEKRITIDCKLSFSRLGNQIHVPEIAIAEIKNLDRNPNSRFNLILDSHGIRKCNFSKYAVGIAMLNKKIKRNRFKEKLNQIHKLRDEYLNHFKLEHA